MKYLLTILALIFTACGSGKDDNQLNFRAINVIPDASLVDIVFDNGVIFPDMPFLTDTKYTEVTEGSHTLTASVHGEIRDIDDKRTSLNTGIDYTYIVFNGKLKTEGVLLKDDNAKPTSGKAKIRFFHAASDIPTLKVYILPTGTTSLPELPSLKSLSFRSNSDYVISEPGTYYLATTTGSTSKLVTRRSPNFSINEGDIKTIVFAPGDNDGLSYGVFTDD